MNSALPICGATNLGQRMSPSTSRNFSQGRGGCVRYRKVDPRIWNDAKFASLSDAAKLAFMLTLTHPYLTVVGAMRTGVSALRPHTNMSPRTFEKAFRELTAKGMVKYEEQVGLLWLPNFLKYNPPLSPNVVRSWPKALDLLPECDFREQIFAQLRGFLEDFDESFRKAFCEAFDDSFLNQKQYQKQEEEQEDDQEEVESQGLSDLSPYVQAWNELRGPLTAMTKLTAGRRKKLKARISEGLTIQQFRTVVGLCARTPFLRGETEGGWRASFDWLIANDTNIAKVFDGTYAKGTSTTSMPVISALDKLNQERAHA